MNTTPQPAIERITPFAGNPLVVGIEPGQPDIVVVTAARLAETLKAKVYFAYADPQRITEREFPTALCSTAALIPTSPATRSGRPGGTSWSLPCTRRWAGTHQWEFRYLAGRADRALTHLARAVDASMIVIGTRRPGSSGRVKRLLQGT